MLAHPNVAGQWIQPRIGRLMADQQAARLARDASRTAIWRRRAPRR